MSLFLSRRLCGSVFFLLVLAVLPCGQALAALPQPVEQGLTSLIELSSRRGGAYNPADAASILDYVMRGGSEAADLTPERRYDGNGTVLRMTVKSPLSRILRYCYNPAIPNYLIFPSVLRLSGWYPGSDLVDKEPRPWTLLPKLDKPVLLWGTEYEVNTPDSFGGGYYRYDLHRLLILTKHNGKNVLISVSRQKGRSSPGKKAVILDDNEWSYFYSGINGLNNAVISFLAGDTYLHDSCSVQVYVEDSPTQTTVTLFKWLRAGTTYMNVVQKSHIQDGLTRYATAFKKIVESNKLPDADEFAARVREFNAMSDTDIESKISVYSQAMERICKNVPAMAKGEFQRIIEGGKYGRTLNREERISAILVEYLKSRLGKTALIDFGPAAAARPKGS